MALLPGSRAARRVSLAFGDPIPCPAVTFVEREIRSSPFSEDLRCDLDWDQWERLSRREGSFVFDPGVLMLHRIHPGSETTRVLSANGRRREDEILFRRFWPGSVARALTGLYARSERSNEL